MKSSLLFALWCIGVALLGVLSLSGCATHAPPPPVIVTRTVEVIKPIPVPCVEASDVPAEPPRVGKDLTGDATNDAHVLASSAARLRGALEKALAILIQCTR